jgi:putative membrane protein
MKKMEKAMVVMTLLVAVMMAGATIATMQENQNQNQNGNSNRGNRSNSNRMNSNRMNSNTGGNMNSDMGGNMNMGGNANMSGNMSMGSNMGGSMAATSDTEFAAMAAQGSTAEIQMAQLAQQKAASKDVQKYAKQMIKDHTKASNNLMKVASKKQMTLPTTPNADQMQMLSQLQAASGAEFDRMYIQMAGVQAHQMMQGLFQSEISNGTDAEIKSFATKTLPTVQKHLRMAEQMTNTGMTGGNMNGNTGGNMNGNMNTNNNRNRNNSNRGNSNRGGNTNGNTNNSNR